MADYWYVDVYRYYTDSSYARPRKIVDKLKLDWLDAGSMYCSPEVVFFNKEQLQERSGWTEEEVRLLFFDKRVPTCNFGRKEVIEVHALIEFFAKLTNNISFSYLSQSLDNQRMVSPAFPVYQTVPNRSFKHIKTSAYPLAYIIQNVLSFFKG